jgi:hypothetical protein
MRAGAMAFVDNLEYFVAMLTVPVTAYRFTWVPTIRLIHGLGLSHLDSNTDVKTGQKKICNTINRNQLKKLMMQRWDQEASIVYNGQGKP